MELLLRVLVGIAEVAFEVDDGFENLIVGFSVGFAGVFTGETTFVFVFIGESIDLIGSELDLKIGFTFKGVFHADSGSTGNTDGF